jgi:hypothetical protein
MMSLIVGSKIGKLGVTALVVILILFSVIQYIQKATTEAIIKDITIELLQQTERVRNDIDSAIQNDRESNPSGDASIALDRLREFNKQ